MRSTTTTKPSLRTLSLLCLALVVVLATPALAFREEFRSYPQFRYTGGLPGNGWAVNADGEAGFDGAVSQCIPLGYTPTAGSYAAAYHVGRIKDASGFDLGLSGQDVNGMAAVAIGLEVADHAACFTWDMVDDDPDAAYSLQVQLLRETEERPAVSVGVLDLLNQREAIHGTPPGDNGARSFYLAATKKLGAEENPLHVTLGVGSDRFNNGPFVGVSYDAAGAVKVLAEYDGFAFNAGVAADLLGGSPKREEALILFVGAAALNRPVVGISYAR